MTAVVIQLVDRRRSASWRPRKHGELLSDRLYLTLRDGRMQATGRAAASRAYRLYREGAPCWLHRLCMLSARHAGNCQLPVERGRPEWAMR